MATSGIPKAVRELIERHIFSVSQLDTLRVLHEVPQRAWTAAELAREIYSNEQAVNDILQLLERSCFIVASSTGDGQPGFRYEPSGEISGAAVSELMSFYDGARLRVIELIFNKPSQQQP